MKKITLIALVLVAGCKSSSECRVELEAEIERLSVTLAGSSSDYEDILRYQIAIMELKQDLIVLNSVHKVDMCDYEIWGTSFREK